MEIPESVDELTPEWFSAVLQAKAPGTAVEAVDVIDRHSGTTGRARVRLRLRSRGGAEGRPVPDTLFVKLAPFDAGQRAFLDFTGIGVVEARFYAALGDTLPVRVPQVWHAAASDEGAFVMVLEDLVGSGCRFPTPDDPDVEEQAASTVAEMARLHAAFWETSRFDDDLSFVPTRAGFGALGTGDEAAQATSEFVRRAADPFRDDMPAVFRAVADVYVERTAEVLDLWDQGTRTLIHGDAHMNNLFVDEGRTGFFDWAMLSRSPAVRDVSYFSCYSLPRPVRRSVEESLLDHYRATLAGLGHELDADTVWEHYRLFSVYAWVSATTTAAEGGRWQPEGYAMEGLHRATAALDDLDAPGVLRDLLP